MDGQGVSSPLRDGDPATIGSYTLTGRLGEGGMGTVYLGRSATGRQVAIKVVKRQFTEDTGFAARFRSEVASARKVASFCTARVLDDGVAEDGRPYMVTDFISGTSLSTQITAYGPLEESPLVGMAFGICAALAAIHAAGLVHRDLKPGNVILSMTGPRVIDFGIARALGGLTGPTLTGEVVGTPGWWAPEQIDGGPVTPAADVFAWGCLVAYAGSGRHPFGEGDPMTVAYRILNEEPRLSGLPEPLDRLVRRALQREPAARPTARDLLLALIGGDDAGDGPSTRVLEALWEPPKNLHDPGGAPDSRHSAGRDGEPGQGPHPERSSYRGTGRGPFGTPLPGSGLWRGWSRRRTRRVSIAVVVTLAVCAGAVLVARWGALSGDTETGRAGPGQANDIGRRIAVGDRGLQLLVSAPPVCGSPVVADGKSVPGRQQCRAYWFVLNMGGTPIRLTGRLDLVDDAAQRHQMAGVLTTSLQLALGAPDPGPPNRPVDLQPGQVLTFGGTYELAAERAAVALAGRIVAGDAPVEIRL
ncbi:serine/threonine-protein kinase [Sphaerisporangium dianthi]|uniref:Serine/threonine-protein kinase n=1 Tax=Sphaerisporangium dianthi TaxID=1436120 RepID=A0ABV9CN96_9ACTN